jgi:hypothetical protein
MVLSVSHFCSSGKLTTWDSISSKISTHFSKKSLHALPCMSLLRVVPAKGGNLTGKSPVLCMPEKYSLMRKTLVSSQSSLATLYLAIAHK